ncbi:MAG: helix-turn-helix transcriptional regulator [Ruminococcaceae bacterium]|nr:helix-turn-helix transcriptional regulator [Oscillospiraceae bacterium]
MKENLIRARNKAGLTQKQIAESLGIGQSTVAMWETGESTPRSTMLPLIAKVYNCSLTDLFEEKNVRRDDADGKNE